VKRCSLLLLCLASACAKQSGIQRQELERGVFQLDCAAPLGRCGEEADKICGGEGYEVISGYDQRKLYGHEAGESQVEVRTSRLIVSCRGPRSASKPPKPAQEATAGAKPALLCTPGTTQRCYGAGACEGGQSCLPDGSGYGSCDCGKVEAAPATSPTPAP